MTEKISVIIVTRNREKMLAGCLLSLVKQTRLPDEVIIVDNASTDSTKKVILSFEKKLPIRYFLEKRIGMPYTQNKGIKEASGTLMLMLDDDCVADKSWVERMILAHKKYPKTWAIQGRTISLPKTRLHSVLAEFNAFLSVRNHAKKIMPIKSFIRKYFIDEIAILTCDAKNFSIKTSYLKKHKLFFDERFYRGLDTDLGKQIIKKNGLIIFCPSITLFHWERPSLTQFLKQRWHTGRTAARIGNKWKIPTAASDISSWPKKFFTFLLFCKISNQFRNLPILLILLFLDRLCYLNGWFYEKMVLSLSKQ